MNVFYIGHPDSALLKCMYSVFEQAIQGLGKSPLRRPSQVSGR